jgi:DNA primase
MSVVDDVKARLDITEIVSGYASLHKAGRNYKALCPFHQEKTPSFIVFPDTQTWRCFGACGEGGDIFSFVMKAEGWDFSEALRELAKRAGVELTPYTPQQEQQQTENERLRGLLNEAAHFFHTQLRDAPAAQTARDYVLRRSLNETTAEAFVLGYAPDDWRQALQHLQMLGYTQDEVVEAGVAIRNEKGNVYDRFRHRLMIPIRDGRGHTVGFGARALEKDAVPKYLNSPQGPLFDKSRLLFGLDMARRAIRETETVVIVEGYMDVMQAHQAGFLNVVAQMGTALTEEQLRQLDRYATRLILALDPDTAGINATMRGLNVAQQTLDDEQARTFDPVGMMRYTGILNMDIQVIRLPEGQDPDDLIREHPDEWAQLITRSIPVNEYVIQEAAEHLPQNATYNEREKVARQLLPLLTATESNLLSQTNIQALARHLHIDDYTLIQWAHSLRIKNVRAFPSIKEQARLADRSHHRAKIGTNLPGQSALREGFFLWMLIDQPDRVYAANRKLRELRGEDEALSDVLAPLTREDFSRADFQAIFQALKDSLYQEELDPIDYLYAHLSPELIAVLQDLRVTPEEIFQHALPRSLKTEFLSILRDQARINTRPAPDLNLCVEEALVLRLHRLERGLNELYFLQQEATDLTDQHYRNTVDVYTRARQLIALALKEMKSLYRET